MRSSRYQPSERLLQLALEMQSSRMGVSLPDIESQFRCSRRTAQRMRDAVVRAYPQVETVVDSERRPRWRIPAGGVVTPGVVTADELADLEATIMLLRQQNQRRRADALQMVLQKLRATLPRVRIVTIPDTGHYTSEDKPAEVLALIDSFLAQK